MASSFDACFDLMLVSAVMDDLTDARAAEEVSHQHASMASLVLETDAAPARKQHNSQVLFHHNLVRLLILRPDDAEKENTRTAATRSSWNVCRF